MSNRIDTIIKYIDLDDRVVDIGCDHALVPKKLAIKGIPSIASDINESIINKRKGEDHSPLITFKVSDGLKNIDDNSYDTVITSGMGSNLIYDIISKSSLRFKKLITVSNKDYYELRKNITSLGFIIDKEEIIYENNKFYNLIVFIKGNKNYSNEELLLGVNHQNIDLFIKYNKYLLEKYNSILNEIPTDKLDDKMNIEYRIDILNKSLIE